MPISVMRSLHHDLNIKILWVSTALLLLSCEDLFLCEIENTKSDAKTYKCLLYIALKSMSLPFSTNYDTWFSFRLLFIPRIMFYTNAVSTGLHGNVQSTSQNQELHLFSWFHQLTLQLHIQKLTGHIAWGGTDINYYATMHIMFHVELQNHRII